MTREGCTRVLRQLPHLLHGPHLWEDQLSGQEVLPFRHLHHQKAGVDMKACRVLNHPRMINFVVFICSYRGIMNLKVPAELQGLFDSLFASSCLPRVHKFPEWNWFSQASPPWLCFVSQMTEISASFQRSTSFGTFD